ncbi:MAG: hypothetical protein CV087_07590 [Candidatus Brocadia sp. WS118]|nr:MAG: hypothetical protein CV087_07590 [Candidatus Brocadia sp. WS118]
MNEEKPQTNTPEPAAQVQTLVRQEGWTWLINSRKWHYFREGRSLCGKFLLLDDSDLELGNDSSPDNCAACRKKLLAA